MARVVYGFPKNQVMKAGQVFFKDYLDNVDDGLLRDVAQSVIKKFQKYLYTRYTAGSSKDSGKSIQTSGKLGKSIQNANNWKVDIRDKTASVMWSPTNDPDSELKLRTLSFGSRPMAQSSQDIGYTRHDEGGTGVKYREMTKDEVKARGGFTGRIADKSLKGKIEPSDWFAAREDEGSVGGVKEEFGFTTTGDTRMQVAGLSGEFRRNIRQWVDEKGIDIPWYMVVKAIAEKGIQPANPSLGFAGNSAQDLFYGNQFEKMPFVRLSAKGESLVREAIKEVTAERAKIVKLHDPKTYKGAKGRADLSLSDIISMNGEVIRQVRSKGGKQYTFLMAIIRNEKGQISSVLATQAFSGVVQA
tara:strand:- start:2378 stop:3451 length:1074 start_codon:yes stop_codon:yes gene_type:complete